MKDNTFLTDFLQLSDYRTLLFIAVLVASMGIIRYMEKRKAKFCYRMITGSVVGLVVGGIIQFSAGFPKDPGSIKWLNEVSSWYGLVGNGYMDLLKMLVVPLVFFSIVRVIMNMKGDNLGKMTGKTIGMLVGTTLIAAIIGIFLGSVFNLGNGLTMEDKSAEIRELTTMVDTFRGLLPANVVKAMAEGNVVAVVIFAAFIGIAIRRLTKKYSDVIEPFVKWVEAFYKIILSVAMTVIKFMPYAVIAMLSNTITSRGVGVLASVGLFIVVTYLGIILMFGVHLVIAAVNGVSPIAYIKNGMEPLLLAFTSRSSLGTLPVLIETLDKKFGVNEGVASFVGSLGCNMGMNGCAGLYSALVTVVLAQITGVPMDLSFYLMLATVIAISSFGIAGLPGAATISISVVISGMGMGEFFPLIGAIVAIDPILDMGRTLLNVSGTMVSAIAVGNSMSKKQGEA
ncbi:MAG: cation:dicarboxylase symporter family transporter [bacterium]|nr:cation:dicarboxylase symporter family transporter [bacterium]